MTDQDQLHAVEQFLYREARLLDERRFEEWLELFAADAHYWVPTRSTREWGAPELSEPDGLAHFDDSRQTLELRVRRLFTEFAWAEDPPSRTRHLISNVEVQATEKDDEISVRSAFVVYRNRLEDVANFFVGGREDLLRVTGDSFLIARRKVTARVFGTAFAMVSVVIRPSPR